LCRDSRKLNFVLFSDEYHKTKSAEAPRTFSFADEKEITSEYWLEKGQSILSDLINRKDINNRAKNVIMFLGDGMSFPTVASTRMYMGAEEMKLSFEKFPYSGFSKVNLPVRLTICHDMR
jgi:alkaline phosphatase